MLNKIWFWLFVLGVTVAAVKGGARAVGRMGVPGEDPVASLRQQGKELTDAGFASARTAVDLSLAMIGGFALFLGIMRIAQDAGLVQGLANVLRPLVRRLFPDIPDGHPAAGAILMNFSANVLGLDNAATPLGLKAMKELQKLNPRPGTATNAMAMFLAINTSSITLIPTGILVLRAAARSQNPAAPIFATLIATTISTTVAIVSARWLQSRFPATGPDDGGSPQQGRPVESPESVLRSGEAGRES